MGFYIHPSPAPPQAWTTPGHKANYYNYKVSMNGKGNQSIKVDPLFVRTRCKLEVPWKLVSQTLEVHCLQNDGRPIRTKGKGVNTGLIGLCGEGHLAELMFLWLEVFDESREMSPNHTIRHSPSWIEVKPYVLFL